MSQVDFLKAALGEVDVPTDVAELIETSTRDLRARYGHVRAARRCRIARDGLRSRRNQSHSASASHQNQHARNQRKRRHQSSG